MLSRPTVSVVSDKLTRVRTLDSIWQRGRQHHLLMMELFVRDVITLVHQDFDVDGSHVVQSTVFIYMILEWGNLRGR